MDQQLENSPAGDSFIVFIIGVLLNPWLALVANTLGVITNSILIATTVYTRKLRNSVNILLAFESFFLLIGQIGFIFVSVNTIYQFLVPYGICAFFTVSMIISLQTGPVLTLFLAFDRMIAVVVPIWTLNGGSQRQWILATMQIAGSLVAGCVFTVTMVGVLAITQPKSLGTSIVCSQSEIFDPAMPSHPLADTKNYVLCVGGFVAYFTLWAVLRRRENLQVSPSNNNISTGTNNNHNNSFGNPLTLSRRVFRPLCVYAALDVASWLLGPLNEQLVPLFRTSPNVTILLFGVVFNATGAAMVMKPVTLYCLSEEYRKATNKTIRNFWRCLKRVLSSFWHFNQS